METMNLCTPLQLRIMEEILRQRNQALVISSWHLKGQLLQSRKQPTFLNDLQLDQKGPLAIYNNNTGSVSLSRKPVHHDCTKRIDIRYHFIREQVDLGSVTVLHVPSVAKYCRSLDKTAAQGVI
jgi:hypothetical protein